MNKNKGVIGIGLILAIVLGVVVVGGGAYYVGVNQNKKITAAPEYKYEVPTPPFLDESNYISPTPNCNSNSLSSIKVLSPNGGEVFTTGQKITVKWESCNIPKTHKFSIALMYADGEFQGAPPLINLSNSTINDGIEVFDLKINDSGLFTLFMKDNDLPNGSTNAWSNKFTINSTTISTSKNCVDAAKSLLPEYISRGQLSDFKLNKVELFALKSDALGSQYFTGNPSNNACMVSVNYSVKPKPEFYAERLPANGHEASDGWIIGKSGFATVDRNSSGYYIVSMGTGY